ncbi:GIY-YIG nuclease family protein [Candidatus Pacebacteria bacterium]|nr:GIY-YIG nuclease family protein [Candidatus Paceibacterota bacterium]
MFYVYILLSEKDNKTYVGYTNNLRNRLRRHNSGQVKSTSARRPLKFIYTESFDTKK